MTSEKTPGCKSTRGRRPSYDYEVIKRLILERKDEIVEENGYSIVSKLNPIWSEISSRKECPISESALYTFVSFNKSGVRDEINQYFFEKRKRLRSAQKDSMNSSNNSKLKSSMKASKLKVFKSKIRKISVNSTRSIGERSTVLSEEDGSEVNKIRKTELEREGKTKCNLERWGDINLMDSTETKFIWTIQNFSSRYLATGEILTSTVFNTGWNDKDQWRLLLFPKGTCELDKDSVHIYLELIRTPRQRVELDVIFSIVKPGTNETTEDKKVIKQVFDQNGVKRGVKNIIKSTEITSFLENDTFKICCEFHPTPDYARHCLEFDAYDPYDRRPIDVKSTNIEAELLENPVKLSPRLCDQLWHQFQTSKNSDAVIIVKQKSIYEKFHVHKFILQARSSVFSEMFDHHMKENSTHEIVIEGIKPDVVKKMLQFIYTDSIDNFEEMAEDLLIAADRYALEALKDLCEQVLFEKIEVSNAVGTLVLAEKSQSKFLKDRVVEFIQRNLKRVTETADYGTLEKSHPKLVFYLVRAMASQETKSKKEFHPF